MQIFQYLDFSHHQVVKQRNQLYRQRCVLLGFICCLLGGILALHGCVPLKPNGSTNTVSADPDAPLYARNKVLVLDDRVYEANFRSVMLFPANNNKNSMLDLPVVFLGDQVNKPLTLIFDELGSQYRNYYVKILACNYDWTPAILQDLEYLEQFNEFPITDYELSSGTRVPYTRYAMTLPAVKLSGNYVAKIYRSQDPDDVVITRRFIVYENAVRLTLEPKFALDPAYRFTHQQVDFSLSYPDFDLFNPNQMLKVVVRQNGRWDNALYDIKPAFVREEIKMLDYHLLNNENIFGGSNEWRALDARSMRFMGLGVDASSYDNNKAELVLEPVKIRNERNYNQAIDINGRFVVENFETRNSTVVPDYQFVTFQFQQAKLPGDVYVFGAFSDFRPDPRYKMRFDSARSVYKARILLKQGYYNYLLGYLKPGATNLDLAKFEGDYEMTENLYDVIAYFRPIGSRYDRCIGYNSFDYFDRGGKK